MFAAIIYCWLLLQASVTIIHDFVNAPLIVSSGKHVINLLYVNLIKKNHVNARARLVSSGKHVMPVLGRNCTLSFVSLYLGIFLYLSFYLMSSGRHVMPVLGLNCLRLGSMHPFICFFCSVYHCISLSLFRCAFASLYLFLRI